MSGLTPRALSRAAARHRGLLAAGLAAAAVASSLSVLAPDPPATSPVLAAARDLSAGSPLTAADVRTVRVPVELVPAGALRDPAAVEGRLVAGPVRKGEPLTDVRLLGAGLLPPGPDVAVPVRLAEPVTGALVGVGDRVDVLSAAPEGGVAADVVAGSLRVLAVPDLDGSAEGALLVLAASRSSAARLAAAAVTGRLSVVVHGR